MTTSHKTIPPPQPVPLKHSIQKVEILREFPESGYRYWQRPDRHIRILLHGHYRIAYVIKTSSAIDILGVFHGALNIDRYLL